jgi:hypothetical protein
MEIRQLEHSLNSRERMYKERIAGLEDQVIYQLYGLLAISWRSDCWSIVSTPGRGCTRRELLAYRIR